MNKKLVLFGAGKIGRSFIGQVFSRSGYEVVFIDINRKLVDLLNERGQYKVVIKSSKGDEIIPVLHVKGVHLSDSENVIAELAGCYPCGVIRWPAGITLCHSPYCQSPGSTKEYARGMAARYYYCREYA